MAYLRDAGIGFTLDFFFFPFGVGSKTSAGVQSKVSFGFGDTVLNLFAPSGWRARDAARFLPRPDPESLPAGLSMGWLPEPESLGASLWTDMCVCNSSAIPASSVDRDPAPARKQSVPILSTARGIHTYSLGVRGGHGAAENHAIL